MTLRINYNGGHRSADNEFHAICKSTGPKLASGEMSNDPNWNDVLNCAEVVGGAGPGGHQYQEQEQKRPTPTIVTHAGRLGVAGGDTVAIAETLTYHVRRGRHGRCWGCCDERCRDPLPAHG